MLQTVVSMQVFFNTVMSSITFRFGTTMHLISIILFLHSMTIPRNLTGSVMMPVHSSSTSKRLAPWQIMIIHRLITVFSLFDLMENLTMDLTLLQVLLSSLMEKVQGQLWVRGVDIHTLPMV